MYIRFNHVSGLSACGPRLKLLYLCFEVEQITFYSIHEGGLFVKKTVQISLTHGLVLRKLASSSLVFTRYFCQLAVTV